MIVGDVIHNITKSLQREHKANKEANRRAKAVSEAQEIGLRESLRNEYFQTISSLESEAINATNKELLTQKVLSAIRAEIKEYPLGTLTIPFFTRPVSFTLFNIGKNLSYAEIFGNPKIKDLVKLIKSEGLKIKLRLPCSLDDVFNGTHRTFDVVVPRRIVKAIRKSVNQTR